METQYGTKLNKTYSVNIHGLRTIFSTSTQIDPQLLQSCVEQQVARPKCRYHKDASGLNTEFMDTMNIVIPVLEQFDAAARNNQEAPVDCNHDTQHQHFRFTFKVSHRHKETVFDRHWKEHSQELAEFKRKFGHPNVSRTTPGYDQLGNWLADQRKKLRRGKLTKEQYDALTELGVDWDPANINT